MFLLIWYLVKDMYVCDIILQVGRTSPCLNWSASQSRLLGHFLAIFVNIKLYLRRVRTICWQEWWRVRSWSLWGLPVLETLRCLVRPWLYWFWCGTGELTPCAVPALGSVAHWPLVGVRGIGTFSNLLACQREPSLNRNVADPSWRTTWWFRPKRCHFTTMVMSADSHPIQYLDVSMPDIVSLIEVLLHPPLACSYGHFDCCLVASYCCCGQDLCSEPI